MHIPTYLLTCETAIERRQPAVAEIVRVFGAEPTLVFSPSKALIDWRDKTFPVFGAWMQPGEICCATGHLLMCLALLKSSHEFALFMEDDVRLLADKDAFKKAILSVRSLGLWHWINFERIFEEYPDCQALPLQGGIHTDQLEPSERISYGTACYAISRAGAEKILYSNIPIINPSDHAMRKASNVVAYNAKVAMADQGTGGGISLIHT